MARTGRPRLANPRDKRVIIRLTSEEHTELLEYAATNNLSITQTLVSGFNLLKQQDELSKTIK